MKLSIIIPAYNTEKYIEECLNSIVPILTDETELIIINDGSTDKTLSKINKVVDKYKDKNVTIITYHTNRGLSYARNKGFDMCIGDFIAYIDSDDYVDVAYIENILEAIKSNKDFYRLSWHMFNAREEDYIANKLPSWNCSVWSYVYNRRIHTERFDETRERTEDMVFTNATIKNGMRQGYIHKIIYYYRYLREGSLSEVKPPIERSGKRYI